MNRSTLQMPDTIERDETTYSPTTGKFIVQPLERGFGITLGNAFRRVLLSSLQGVAITHLRIEGAHHEFQAVKGVVEDVSEMVLNLKQVRLKLTNKRPDKISLHLKGAMDFTAGEIEKASADVEVLNPELHIASLNKDADLQIELRINKGRGYVPAEENKLPDQPIGVIPLDAIFNPIVKVNYRVENMRVGHRIDYERLILDVTTDGSITPEDALTFAGKILKDHIELFIKFDIEPESDEEAADVDEDAVRIRKLLKMNVEELELSVRSQNCLKAADIHTIGDLVMRGEPEMLKFRNFGRKSLQELAKILEEKGLYFGMDVERYMKSESA
jgi:DNA-directed RNA polymerase subunit alpha